MKAAQLVGFGVPEAVVECVEVDEPGAPDAGEVVVQMLACPINPAEILLIEGRYAGRPELPARLGIEGAGRVTAVGAGVGDVAVGDLVMCMGRANWVERVAVTANQVVRGPADIDVVQLSMLKVNPATAHLMLTSYVNLEPGDWLIQNAANSAVGTILIRLARSRGVRTINVVRRESLVEPLRSMGADVVMVDGEDLAERVRPAVAGAPVKLAIDAVAGAATMRLADCLGEGGTVVNYGLLSGEPCMIRADQTVFRGITLTGFWLAKELPAMSPDALHAMYGDLMRRIRDRSLEIEVEATYPLEDVKQAVAHAAREGRSGKILITPG